MTTTENLYYHLALLLRYFEQETSQGDGIAEEHFEGYMAAKRLLVGTPFEIETVAGGVIPKIIRQKFGKWHED